MAKEKSKKKDKAETVSWSEILEKAFSHMATAKAMTDHFEANFKEVSNMFILLQEDMKPFN